MANVARAAILAATQVSGIEANYGRLIFVGCFFIVLIGIGIWRLNR